ncbi:hypothetical protein CYL31_02650 [Marinomonas sp. A3A]|uniref:hypothetical protein n=1 Tax=Marinomonas sp. A3A TaxID=2065312 RepID=UPI001BB3A839|nr:hypothetical protein [Marinomonas sp. A3A]QUX90364.1 hypothetical protein CYL31_02650 [Marinomonas sp. A3A]
MNKQAITDSVNFTGSVASITGISLLAFENTFSEINVVTILSYLVGSAFFLGITGVTCSLLLKLKGWLFSKFSDLVACSILVFSVGASIWWVMFIAKVCHFIAKELKYFVGWH